MAADLLLHISPNTGGIFFFVRGPDPFSSSMHAYIYMYINPLKSYTHFYLFLFLLGQNFNSSNCYCRLDKKKESRNRENCSMLNAILGIQPITLFFLNSKNS